MIVGPPIQSAQAKQRYTVGKHTAVLLAEIVPVGGFEFRYILVVYDGDTQQPFFFVAAEANRWVERDGGGSHFLCTWGEEGHSNYGDSDKWADEAEFVAEALRLARAKCGVLE